MLPHMSDIWTHLADEIFPHTVGRRQMFIDLADPEKRTAEDIGAALAAAAAIRCAWADVTLGSEPERGRMAIAPRVGLAPSPDAADEIGAIWPPRFADRSDLACVVIHPRGGASAATADATASFAGPFVAPTQ